MRLYLLECKKIMTSRFHLIPLLLFMMLPMVISQNRITDTGENTGPYRHADGSRMSKEEIQEEVCHEKLKWTGTMDVAWWDRLKVAEKAVDKRIDMHFFNMEKVNALYGKDWYEDYQSNKRNYAYVDDIKEVKKGRRISHLREEFLPNYKEDIADEVVSMLYLNYGKTMLADKPRNSEDGTFGTTYSLFNNEKVVAPVYSLDVSRAEFQLLKDYMNEKEPSRYGDSREWFPLLGTYSTVGIVPMVWVLVASSNAVNRERKQNMLGAPSSRGRGDSALFSSKLAAVITCVLIGLLLMILPVTLYAWLSGNFGDMAVNIIEGLHMISVFTYQEGFLISMEVLVLGAVICTVLGTLVSTRLKPSYVSLGFCMLCMLAGTASSSYVLWMKLFPFKFMELTCVAVRGFTCNLFDQIFLLWKLFPLIWTPYSLLLCYATLRIYCFRSHHGIQKL